jgi:hypothetical protein
VSSQHKGPLAAFVVVSLACVVVLVNALRSDAFISGIFTGPTQVVVAGARLVPAPHDVLAAEARVVTRAKVGLDAAPHVLDPTSKGADHARSVGSPHHRSSRAGIVGAVRRTERSALAAVPAPVAVPGPAAVPVAAGAPAEHHSAGHHRFPIPAQAQAAPQPAAAPVLGATGGRAAGRHGHDRHSGHVRRSGHARPPAVAAGTPATVWNGWRGQGRGGAADRPPGRSGGAGHHGRR